MFSLEMNVIPSLVEVLDGIVSRLEGTSRTEVGKPVGS